MSVTPDPPPDVFQPDVSFSNPGLATMPEPTTTDVVAWDEFPAVSATVTVTV